MAEQQAQSTFVDDLRWRNLLHDMTPGIEAYLSSAKSKARAYIGFDPSSDSLTVGNLVALTLLLRFQQHGHTPVVLIGGATGMIGDPSGKNEERPLLSQEKVLANANAITRQIRTIFSRSKGPDPIFVNNLTWFGPIKLLTFLRDVGKHLTISYMISKESVAQRLKQGISFTEFSYQLLQAYDFYHLMIHHNVMLQMGASDQWGNITSGIELIRRKVGRTAYGLTCPLLTRPDGTKYGKTAEGQNIWLDPKRTSPYQFYQFWMNTSDEEAERFIVVFSMKNRQTIEQLIASHRESPHRRILQRALAEEMTVWVHGSDALAESRRATEVLFGKQSTIESLHTLPEHLIRNALHGVPIYPIPEIPSEGMPLVEVLVQSRAFPSKAEVRRLIKSGGLSVNRQRITSPDHRIYPSDLIHQKFLIGRKGKKNYFLLEKAKHNNRGEANMD